MRPLQWWVESAPTGGDRVMVSENLGATTVELVVPVDTYQGTDYVHHSAMDLAWLKLAFAPLLSTYEFLI